MSDLKAAIEKRRLQKNTTEEFSMTKLMEQIANEAIQKHIESIKGDITKTIEAEVKKMIGEMRGMVEKTVQDTIQEKIAKQLKGAPGDPGKDGNSPVVDVKTIARLAADMVVVPTEDDVAQAAARLVPVPQVDHAQIARHAALLINAPKGERGDDGSPDQPEEVVAKIHQSSTKLKPTVIEGWDAFVRKMERMAREGGRIIHGGGVTLKFGGVSPGIVTPVIEENLVSRVSGTTFTLLHTPLPGTLRLYRGGGRITRANGDYTYTSGLSGTLASGLVSGETLTADYEY